MPALSNPRYERFAQAILIGISGSNREHYSQGRAYQAAGYRAKDAGKSGGSAEAVASRLLKKVKPILDRVRELQAEALRSSKVTVESIASELDEARQVARANDQASAMVAASATKAKLYGLQIDRAEIGKVGDFQSADNLNELADRMLKDAGAVAIDDGMRRMAIEEMGRHAASIEAIANARTASAAH